MVKLAEEKKRAIRQQIGLYRIEFKRLVARNQEMPPYLQLPSTVSMPISVFSQKNCLFSFSMFLSVSVSPFLIKCLQEFIHPLEEFCGILFVCCIYNAQNIEENNQKNITVFRLSIKL